MAEPDGLPARRRIAAAIAISLGTMVTSIDNGSMSLALPTLARDFGVSPAEAVLVVTVFQLVLIMTVLPLSALGQHLGFRRLYQGGLALFMVSTLTCFFAQSLTILLLVRASQALGAAATFSVSAALIRAIYPKARLGSGLALNTIVAATAASLAPSLGGVILSVASWPWLFATTVPLAAISLLAGRHALPDPPAKPASYDFKGAALCAAMFGLGVTAMEFVVHRLPALPTLALAAGAIFIGSVLIRRERGSEDPMLPIDLLREPPIALATAAGLLANLAAMSLQMTLPFRLQHAYGFSPGEAGFLLTAWPAATMIAAPVSGILSDRIAPGRLSILGMAIAGLGLAALAMLPEIGAGKLDIAWRIALTATGFGLFYSPNARFIIGTAPLPRTAAAGALTQINRMAGQITGSTVAAGLFAFGGATNGGAAMLSATLTVIVLGLSAGTLPSANPRARSSQTQ